VKVEWAQPCLGCGYELRGLGVAGACPECGKGVGESLRGDMLAWSDAGYVRRLVRGAGLAFWSPIVMVLVVIAVGVVEMASSTTLEWLELLALVPSAAFVVAWWMLTAGEPGRESDSGIRRERRLVLLGGFALVGLEGVQLVFLVVGAVPTFVMASTIVDIVQSLVLGGLLWAGMRYVRWLAARIPSELLYRRAGTFAKLAVWWIGAELARGIAAIVYLQWLYARITAPTPPAGNLMFEPVSLAMLGTTAVVMIYGLVLLVMYLVQMGKLRAALGRVRG
jgi:hypothetical protein